jgi:rhamnogalacturonyl hydrolase YesR
MSYKLTSIILPLVVITSGCISSDNKNTNSPAKVTTIATTQTTIQKSETQVFRDSAKDIGTRASAWQFARMDNFDYIRTFKKDTRDTKDWIQGALYIGATRWADKSNDESFQNIVAKMAEGNDYKMGKRPIHADDHAIGQAYLWLHEKTGDEKVYHKVQEQFDAILANKPTGSLEFFKDKRKSYEGTCQDRWCWADALFMAPRTWHKLSNATGDERYRDYADAEYWVTTDYLFSDEHGLFFRDSRYFTKKSDNGEPVFWSRGNGWVFAAIPLIIEELPEGHPSIDRYLELYRKMAASLVKLQKPDGFWPSSMHDVNKVKTPEVSGTAFITFGLAWGVNNDILTDDTSIKAAENGWNAIESTVDNDGMVHWVQQVGKSPDPVRANDTQLYGVGAVLLAASEMIEWKTPEERKKPIAYGRFVPERQDDFTWENDKVAFRVYGPAGPKKGEYSGVDNWFKKVDYPIINKWYADYLNGVSYHKDTGEGHDPYHVGDSRGTGGSAIWVEGKPYAANTFSNYKVIKSGEDEVKFSLEYQWTTPLGLVGETKTVSLAMGEQLYQVNSVFTLDGKPTSLPIAIGLTTHDGAATVSFDKNKGWISAWETIKGQDVGTGAVIEPSHVSEIKHITSAKKDESHIWLITQSDKQGKLSYKAGFAWAAAGDITTSKAWHDYLNVQADAF